MKYYIKRHTFACPDLLTNNFPRWPQVLISWRKKDPLPCSLSMELCITQINSINCCRPHINNLFPPCFLHLVWDMTLKAWLGSQYSQREDVSVAKKVQRHIPEWRNLWSSRFQLPSSLQMSLDSCSNHPSRHQWTSTPIIPNHDGYWTSWELRGWHGGVNKFTVPVTYNLQIQNEENPVWCSG